MATLSCWNTRKDFLSRKTIMKSDRSHGVTRPFLLQPAPTLEPTNNILGANQIDLILQAWPKEFNLHSLLARGGIFRLALKLPYQQVPLNILVPACQKPGSCRKTCLEISTGWGRDLFINQVMGGQAFSKGRSLVKDSVGKVKLQSAKKMIFL